MTITINAVRNETRVNTTTAGSQYYSAAAALADGGYVVAWQGPQLDGWTGTDIFLQRYDASGAKVGGEVTVNTATTNDQTGPIEIVGLSNGGFVVTWDQNGSPYNDDVYQQVFDSAGARGGAAVQINLWGARSAGFIGRQRDLRSSKAEGCLMSPPPRQIGTNQSTRSSS